MKNVTLTLLALALAGGSIFAADPVEKPKEKLVEDLMWEKALAENAKEADRTYAAYQKALAEATGKVVKALESNIKDLNDPKKFDSLTMKQRAAAIEALEKKIADAKNGAIGEAIVAKRNVDALGDPKVDLAKMILGRWTLVRNKSGFTGFMSMVDGRNCVWSNGMRGTYFIKGTTVFVSWSDGGRWEIYITGNAPYKTIQVGSPDLDGVFTKE